MHDEERFKKIFVDVAMKAVFSFFLHGVGRIKSRVEQNKKKLCIWHVSYIAMRIAFASTVSDLPRSCDGQITLL